VCYCIFWPGRSQEEITPALRFKLTCKISCEYSFSIEELNRTNIATAGGQSGTRALAAKRRVNLDAC